MKLASEPPGAQVNQNGQLLAGVTTPAEVLVEAGKAAPAHAHPAWQGAGA